MSPNLFERGIAKAWEYYSKDVGKSLIHWGSVGWVFSSLAQVFAIAINNNIDKKEKKFLIPQELADGAVNVGLYYTITQAIKSLGDSLVDSGSFIKKDTADFLNILKPENTGLKEFIKTNGGVSSIISKIQHEKSFPEVGVSQLNRAVSIADRAADSFSHWKNGVGTLFTILASVLACNVITPYCRNRIASTFQHHHIARTEASKPSGIKPDFALKRPLPSAFNGFRI